MPSSTVAVVRHSVDQAAPVPTPTSVSTEVTLHVDTSPSANVEVDGRDRGATPVDVRVPRSDAAVVVRVTHPGFAPLQRDVVPDHDQIVAFTLSPAIAVASSKPLDKPAPKAPPSAAKPDDFHPFQ